MHKHLSYVLGLLLLIFALVTTISSNIVLIPKSFILVSGGIFFSVGFIMLWILRPVSPIKIFLKKMPQSVWLLYLWFLWCAITLFWGPPENLFDALELYFHLAFSALAFIFLFYIGDGKKAFEGGLMGCVVGGTLVSFLILKFSAIYTGRLGADLAHPTVLGLTNSLSILICYYLFSKTKNIFSRVLFGLIIGICMYCLLLIFGKASIIALIASLLVFMALKGMKLREIFLILSLFTIGIIVGYDRIINNINSYKELDSLTGRTEVWEFAWNMIKSNPLIGYGFRSFEYNNGLPHAHNIILHSLFEGGILQLLLLLGVEFSLLFMAIKAYRIPELKLMGALIIAIVCHCFIRGITELGFEPHLMVFFSVGLYQNLKFYRIKNNIDSMETNSHDTNFESREIKNLQQIEFG